MSSIIKGYEYDIFISYRQKDNKGDRWVSEFVDALKTELESTFKEEISVYFDINPHDGLLETHDVGASLKDKLKCLVFVPVISQTYCDPKSFAWQNEFCAFNKLAKEDQFGRDIRVTGDNVASRILPVKINDLDPEDKTLLENELGGVLRAVEFIYREPGVNRPLTPDDDEKKNLNKTKYRNQINKVANAIKEIIKGLKYSGENALAERTGAVKKAVGKQKTLFKKVAIPFVILAVILIAGFLIIPSLIKKSSEKSSNVSKSIAVLPFVNLSNDPQQEYFSDGMVDAILDRLFKVGELVVTARSASMTYKDTKLSFKEIAKELGVSAILEGSVQKVGENVRIITRLIDAKTEKYLWSETYDRDLTDIFSIQSEIAQNVAQKMKAVINPQIKAFIEKSPTSNIEAYEAYLQGMFYWRKLTKNDLEIAMKYFELAKEKDPKFALAYAGIGFVWLGEAQMGFVSPAEAGPKGNDALTTALKIDSTLDQIHYMTACAKTWSEWDWKSGESEFLRTLAINPNHSEARAYYSHFLNIMGRHKEAMEQIDMAVKLDPVSPLIKALYSGDLLYVHRYDDAIKVSGDALKMDPTNPVALWTLAIGFNNTNRYKEALEEWKMEYKVIYPQANHTLGQGNGDTKESYLKALKNEADTLAKQSKYLFFNPSDIALLYSLAGDKENAVKWFEEGYLKRDQSMPYLSIYYHGNLGSDPRILDIFHKMNLPPQ